MNRFYRSLLLTGIVAAGLAGCGDDVTVVDPPPPPPPPAPQVRGVTVTPDNVSANPGQTIQMTANVTADPGATPTVAWSTSDASRATVSATGLVTIPANAPTGPVAIRATATCATACGTASGAATINVVGTTVTGVTVTPATATINTGQTLQATATVTGTNNPPQTVNWTSLSPAIATVSNTGLVTANATTGGNAVITACSTVQPNICGTLAVEVVVPSPATVSIQSVTFTNSAGNQVPVVLTNVFGQIEIALNVDNGSKTLTRVDAVIGGQVVASQTFSSASPPPAPAAEGAPVVVSLSVNTMQVRKNGNIFVPVIFNGNSFIRADLYVVGSATPIASNAIPVVMNNVDAIIQPGLLNDGTNDYKPTAGTPSVVVGGTTWFGGPTGSVDLATHFLAFSKTLPTAHILSGVGCPGSVGTSAIAGTPTTGIVISDVSTCAGFEGVTTPSAAPAGTSYAPATSGPDGTALTAPTQWSSVGSAFQVAGENRWNLITPSVVALAAFNYDRLAPTVTVDNGPVGVGPAVAFNDAADQQWVNAGYPFAQDIGAADGGVGVAGGFPEARVFTSSCTSTVVTTGADFSETVTSIATDGKRICSYAEDLLANAASSGASNYFGVDFGAPTIRFIGSTAATPAPTLGASTVSSTPNTTIYSILSPPPAHAFGVEALDTRSGFHQGASLTNFPATMTLTRFDALGTVSCNVGLYSGLPFNLGTILSDTWVRSIELPILCDGAGNLGGVGYYAWTGNVTDRAGNSATLIERNFAADHLLPPNITGIGFASAFYTPGAAAPFGFSANDDLEVIDATVAVTQTIPSGGSSVLRYPLGSLSPLGVRWDATITNVINGANASIDYFLFRVDETCSAAGVPYAGCPAPGGPPVYITAPKTAAVGDYTANAAALPAQVSATVADVASQLAAPAISAPFLATQFNPSTGISQQWHTADIVSWSVAVVGSNLVATHVASTSIVVPYFDAVLFWRLDTVDNEWVRCGAFPAPALTDNGAHRFWTYTVAVPTSGPCVGANFGVGTAWRAMGLKNGAGLFTPNF